MLRLLIVLIFLIASVWLGAEIVHHPGYLLLVYEPWMMQMPLWFALLSLIVIFAIFYLLVSSIDRVHLWWFRFHNWLQFRREHKAYSKTQHGLATLIEGRYKKSERLLLAGLNQSFEPLMNYLGAAQAAHAQKAFDRRDLYINKAYEIAPDATLAIGLTQAELEIEGEQFEHAIATLNHLLQSSPYHPRILKLLEKVYVRLADWKNLFSLLPNMRKAKMLTKEQYFQFEKNVYCEMLYASHNENLDEIHRLWNEAPRQIKKNPDAVLAYVKQLLRFNTSLATPSALSNEIETIIRKTLKDHWQAELVKIYASLPFANLNRQLVIVGSWLKLHGPQPEILITLGKICAQLQLWGKAKDYFEKCLMQGPNLVAALEYGRLLEHLDEKEEALQKYRDALAQHEN